MITLPESLGDSESYEQKDRCRLWFIPESSGGWQGLSAVETS